MIMRRDEQIVEASWRYAKVHQKPFVDGAMWADEHPQWTSVEDELPPIEWVYSDLVLVTDGERYHLGLYNHESGDWFDVDFVPTHWMPLPQQPKKGKYIMTKEEK